MRAGWWWTGMVIVAMGPVAVSAQWQMLDGHTTADLRGIDNLGGGVAWASGTNGTVLRTEDGGYVWQLCAIPPGAAKLDFRGVQAFDKDTAIVMSSGKGDLSRLYKTTDGCQTWTLVFTNPEPDGFFDSLRKVTEHQVYLLGDPVGGKFAMYTSRDAGNTWFIADDPGLDAPKGAGAFAASNSAFTSAALTLAFGTGGPLAAVYTFASSCNAKTGQCTSAWTPVATPLAHGPAAAGVFSLGARSSANNSGRLSTTLVAVGGDYEKPAESANAAATSSDGGASWIAAALMPHGYRSAVAYDTADNAWITVGPNGTDISTDDGRNWRALKPGAEDAPDADKDWNALSLPFVVGPKGRIGKLREARVQGPGPKGQKAK